MSTLQEIDAGESSGSLEEIFLAIPPSSSLEIDTNLKISEPWTQTGEFIYKQECAQNKYGSIRYVEIDRLINFNYLLKTPIKAKIITYDNGEIIGDIEELEIYSFGDDEFEVLRELNEELTCLFTELSDIEDERLGKHPKKWKNILNKYIKTL